MLFRQPPHASRARLTAVCLSLATVLATVLATPTLRAQASDKPPRPIISIGDYPNVNGLRLNYRDSDLGTVNGANVTLWTPYDPMSGTVNGLALGLPATGAADINGLALGVLGVGASHDVTGITLAGIGAGAGGRLKGIAFAPIGLGAGGSLDGIMVGGIGVGGGGNARGLIAGGIGAGVGGDIDGIALGGIGAGVGGHLTGLAIGGIGVGAGGSVKGVLVGGVGVGAGGRIDGIVIGGIGAGSGDEIKGIGLAGVGIGAPRLQGGFAALFVGAKDAKAIVLAPAQFRIENGSFSGVSLSASNYVKGAQNGITIGLLNYARSLSGVQVGIINIIANGSSHPVLPLFNWGTH
ncbi:MAG: hypothetical protein HY084_13540 [Gemmatimonadetes bacterium]|nr:hypothetical protein [Gemmatimonadota bacterium]